MIESGISYPNQKHMKIRRTKVLGNTEAYLNIYISSITDAMKNLSNSAFKVYVCLVSNRDGYEFYLSPTAIHRETGVCLDTVRKDLKELETIGYIKRIDDNKYEFKETPYMKDKCDKKEVRYEKDNKPYVDLDTYLDNY